MPKKPHLTSRQIQAQQTKEKIFNASISLLKDMDIEDIKITDIIEAAGVSPGTFYHYYATKWDVYLEAHHFLDDYYEQVVGPNLTQPYIKDRLLLFFNHYFLFHETFTNSLNFLRIVFHMGNPAFSRSLYAEYDYGMLYILRKTIQQGIDDQQLTRDESAVEIAAFLMIAFRGLVFHWCALKGSFDISTELPIYIKRLLRSFLD